MKKSIPAVVLAAVVFVSAAPVVAHSPGESVGMENVMSAGADHNVLDSTIGTFSVKVKTWANPAAPPAEETLTAVNAWVLGDRYLQTTLTGNIDGAGFSRISFLGFDVNREGYESVSMDTENVGMIWYRGEFDSSGKQLTLQAEVPNPQTGEPSMRELRMFIKDDGNHTTEVWVPGPENMMFKTQELQFTKEAE